MALLLHGARASAPGAHVDMHVLLKHLLLIADPMAVKHNFNFVHGGLAILSGDLNGEHVSPRGYNVSLMIGCNNEAEGH